MGSGVCGYKDVAVAVAVAVDIAVVVETEASPSGWVDVVREQDYIRHHRHQKRAEEVVWRYYCPTTRDCTALPVLPGGGVPGVLGGRRRGYIPGAGKGRRGRVG